MLLQVYDIYNYKSLFFSLEHSTKFDSDDINDTIKKVNDNSRSLSKFVNDWEISSQKLEKIQKEFKVNSSEILPLQSVSCIRVLLFCPQRPFRRCRSEARRRRVPGRRQNEDSPWWS